MAPRSYPVVLALLLVLTGGDAQLGDEAVAAPPAEPPGQAKKDHLYPDPSWTSEAPEEHGLSADGLQAMAAVAERFDSSCLMVIHDGVLVGEWYWDGFARDTDVTNVFSVTKSITSTLVGIAQEEGKLQIEQTAATYIPRWASTPSERVTIRNLISNDSGRFWSFESDYVTGLLPALDQTAYAIGLTQQFDPGTVWEYNNTAIQALEEVLSQSTEQDVGAYAQARLFEPIGATSRMISDPSGNSLTYQGVTASCDDMARFGYLALREGQWKGEQVVPKQWIQQATQPSTELNAAYGFMWWLNREGHVVQPSFPVRNEYDGQLVPGASEQLFVALGAFGQLIIVDPKDEYVVVRLQNVTDLNAALATSPDPVGVVQLREIVTAFEAAKTKKKKKKASAN
jgi:CubicO group peptidase (beta-lactamase class C family)